MENDKLLIISFNSARKGLMTLSPGQRPTYLQRLFETAEPDICFLPGDDKYAKLNVIRGYGQFILPDNDSTVLLYNSSRISMKKPQVSLDAFGQLPGLDLDQVVVPEVEVSALEPIQKVVKEFSMVSWKSDFFQTTVEKNVQAETLAESIITFSQRLAMITGKPVLIGGEMNIDYIMLMGLVKKLSHKQQIDLLFEPQPVMDPGCILFHPSIFDTNLRHLFMMKVFQCAPNISGGFVKSLVQANNAQEVVANCFIASKTLELDEASLLDFDKILGRQICMPLLQTNTDAHGNTVATTKTSWRLEQPGSYL